MRTVKFILLIAVLASAAFGQVNNNNLPTGKGGCIATVATLSSACGTTAGTIASVTDGTSASDCSTGLSTHAAICQYNGSAWVPPTASATAGGSNTQLQFNSSTALGGISDWTSNGTTTITGASAGIFDLSALTVSNLKLPAAIAGSGVTYSGGVLSASGGISGLTPATETIAATSSTVASGAHVYLSQTSGADLCAKLNTAFAANPNGVVVEGDLGGNQVCSAANATAAFSNCNNARYEPIVPTAIWLPVTAGTASLPLGNKCRGIFGMGRASAGSGGTGLSIQACTGTNTPVTGCAAPTVQSYTGFTIAAVAATGGHPAYAHLHGTFSPAPSGGDYVLLPCVGASCPGTNTSAANSGRFRICQATTGAAVQNDAGCPANPNGTDIYYVNANAATCASNCGTLYDSSATTLIGLGPAASGFGTVVRDIAIDCDNILGLTGISNNGSGVTGPGSSEEDSGWGGLLITSCVDLGEDIHGNNAQNSGPYGPDEIYIPATDAAGGANSNCNLGTTGIVLGDTTTRGINGVTVSAKMGGTNCTGASYGVSAVTGFYLDAAQNRISGSIHCEGYSGACFELGQNSPATGMHFEDASGMPTGGTSAIDISSNFGNTGLAKFTSDITLISTKKNTGPTNTIVNNISGCTITEPITAFYVWDQNGASSTTLTSSKQCPTILGDGLTLNGSSSGSVALTTASTGGQLNVNGPVNATTGFQIGGAAASNHILCGNGTNYVDNTAGGCGISGSGTVNSGTSGHFSYYASSTTAVSNNAHLDDGATTAGTITSTEPIQSQNLVVGPINPTVSIPSSTLLASGSTTTTTISGSSSTTTVWDLTSTSGFVVGMGACVTSAGAVATIHCGYPGVSSTDDCVGTITAINVNNITVTPACNSAPASGATVFHDDGAALEAALSLCSGTNTTMIVLPDGIYYANITPTTVNGTSFILPLPTVGTPQGSHLFINAPIAVCEISGFHRPALSLAGNPVAATGPQIVTGNTSTTVSLIGGRGTGAAGCGGTCSHFDFLDFEASNIRFGVPSNAGNAVHCGYVARCNIRRAIVDTYTVPASVPTNGVAIILPYVGNANQASVVDSEVYGFATAIQTWEHCTVFNNRIGYVGTGIGIGSDAQNLDFPGGNSGFGCSISGKNLLSSVVYGISPEIDPENGSTVVGGPFEAEGISLEHISGTWATTYDINDSTNLLRGDFRYIIRPPNDTKSPALLNLNGGNFVNRCSMQDNWCSQGINPSGLQWQAGTGTLGGNGTTIGVQAKQFTITQDGAAFVLTAPSALTFTAAAENGFFTSPPSGNFTGHSITTCPVSTLLAADAADFAGIFMAASQLNYVGIYVFNGKIYFVKSIAGTLTVLNGSGSGETYPGTSGTFTCVQLAESSGAFTFKTSTSFGGTLNTDTTCAATCVSWAYTSGVNIAVAMEGVNASTTPVLPGGVKFDPIQIQ